MTTIRGDQWRSLYIQFTALIPLVGRLELSSPAERISILFLRDVDVKC
jgi:hypothetical protein